MGSIKYKWKELDDKSSSSCALDRNYLSRLLKVDGQFDSCFAAKIFHFWYLETDENLIARLTARACDELGLTAGGKSFSVGKLSAVYKAPHISHVCHLSRLLYLQYADTGWKNNRARFHNLCKKKKNCLHLACQQLRYWPCSYSLKSVLRSAREKSKARQPWQSR